VAKKRVNLIRVVVEFLKKLAVLAKTCGGSFKKKNLKMLLQSEYSDADLPIPDCSRMSLS